MVGGGDSVVEEVSVGEGIGGGGAVGGGGAEVDDGKGVVDELPMEAAFRACGRVASGTFTEPPESPPSCQLCPFFRCL